MIAAPLLILCGACALVTVKPAATIDLVGRDLLVSDVADLRFLAPAERRRLQSRRIMRLPAGRSSVTLSRAAIAGLVRRAVPGLQPTAPAGALVIRIAEEDNNEPRAPGRCFALAASVTSGETLTPSLLAPSTCDGAVPRGLIRFDRRDRIARAAASLPAGTMLGALSISAPPDVAFGDKLTLVSAVGPVRVERTVVALQAGWAGRRLFVRAEDGHVISAPVLSADAAERGDE